MDVKLDSIQLNELVTKAIFDNMTPEVQKELLLQSIRGLMVKQGTAYNSRSVIEDAFLSSASFVAEKLIREKLEKDPDFIAQVDGLFRAVVHKIFEEGEPRDKVINGMVTAFVNAMSKY